MARIVSEFAVEPSPYAEPTFKPPKVEPRAWVQALAYFKARAVANRRPSCWVLGADTMVVCAGHVLGKPSGLDDARRMLELQARQPCDVLTGLCLVRGADMPRRRTRVTATRVWMRDDAERRELYLQSGHWRDKAGAYGIQDVGDRLVERIDGSFTNVVGLPLETTTEMLRQVGLVVNNAAGPD